MKMNRQVNVLLPKCNIAKIYNRSVVPEENPRYPAMNPKPVARRDLPKDFQENVQMGWNDYLIYNTMFDYDFATAIRPFSACMWFNGPNDGEIPGWRDVAKKYADKGLILDSIWGIRHGMPFKMGSGEMIVPDDVQQFLLDTFGPRFWGWENGEQDGEYLGQYVFGSWNWPKQSKSRTRKDAYDDFVHFNKDVLDRLFHNYVVTIGSLGFSHYYAEIGHRMIGLELGTGLQSTIMRFSFLRGASKQYDVLTHGQISIFLARPEQKPYFYSSKCYPSQGRGIKVEFQYAHPDGGIPIDLAKRLWFASYLYGVSAMGTEGGLFYDDMAALPKHYYGTEAPGVRPPVVTEGAQSVSCSDGAGDAVKKSLDRNAELENNLTPFGRQFRQWVWTTRTHPNRGVMYVPFALVLDYFHGWNPPVHKGMGQSDPECVWGNIPYSLGDYHIDQFFRWVYPGYLEYAYAINGRGCLTPTPFGDSFDVLLSNASKEALGKYQAAILLGQIPIDPKFAARMMEFVLSGRAVVMCTQQMTSDMAKMAGIKIVEKNLKANISTSLVTGKTYQEAEYLYDRVELDGAEVLATNEAGHPLICVHKFGDGQVFSITPVYWATGRRPDYKWHINKELAWDMHFMNDYFQGQPLPPANLLKVVQEIIGSVLKSYSLIELTGRPLQYIVNVTDDSRKLIVGLINNGETPWEGRMCVKGQKIESCTEWLSMGETCIENGVLFASVPATDVRIYEVTCEEPFLDLIKQTN